MKLHEYQAKSLFRRFGIPVPEGEVAASIHDAAAVAEKLQGPPWVVKAQIHAGGRGKGGGVQLVHSPEELKKASKAILSQPLITKQTGSKGKKVHKLLIEQSVEIQQELYLAMTIDRTMARPVMIFSQAGGMDIEDVGNHLRKNFGPGGGVVSKWGGSSWGAEFNKKFYALSLAVPSFVLPIGEGQQGK